MKGGKSNKAVIEFYCSGQVKNCPYFKSDNTSDNNCMYRVSCLCVSTRAATLAMVNKLAELNLGV